MKTAAQYRENASECRKLASTMDGDGRDQLLQMAETWEQLAEERERQVSAETTSFLVAD